MSLAVLALRICAVKALTGATSVGARVYDSDVDPRDLSADEASPVIVVYADTGKMNIDGLDLLGCTHTVELVIDSFVARQVSVAAGEGEDRVTYQCPPTDAGHELYLGALGFEITRALLGSSGWADLWRRFAFRASASELSEWDRGAHAEKGVRFAVRRTLYRIETMADPVPGAALPPLWADFVAACEADDELAELGAYLRALITLPAAPDWRQAQQALGLGLAGVRGIGLAPEFETATEPAPALAEGAVEDTDRDEAVTVTDDTATIGPVGGTAVPIVET